MMDTGDLLKFVIEPERFEMSSRRVFHWADHLRAENSHRNFPLELLKLIEFALLCVSSWRASRNSALHNWDLTQTLARPSSLRRGSRRCFPTASTPIPSSWTLALCLSTHLIEMGLLRTSSMFTTRSSRASPSRASTARGRRWASVCQVHLGRRQSQAHRAQSTFLSRDLAVASHR